MTASTGVPATIFHLQEQFWQALQTRDAELFRSIIASDFVGRSPGEPNQTREDLIATFARFPGSIKNINGDAIEVHVWENIAILTGVQVAQLQLPDGRLQTSRVMLSNTFRNGNEGWQMVLCFTYELVQDQV